LNPHGIWGITIYSFKEALKARWLQIFAIAYFMLAINVPTLVLLALHYLPPDYLSTYLETSIALSFQLIPLLALPMGATSIVDERESGTLQFVMSNPITKGEFFVGKALGLLLATSSVVVLGFGIAAIISHGANVGGYGGTFDVLLVAGGLNMTMLFLALVVSCLTKRKSTALGVAILIWLFITVITDLGVFAYVLNLGAGVAVPFILLNPVEMTRILAILLLGGSYSSLGATGVLVRYTLGGSTYPILWATLVAYNVVLSIVGFFIFRHQDLV
jgi:ABC-type transport system involved in multi-copper enzyme maturation permease subunit